LSGLAGLERLNLEYTNVTDGDLASLVTLKQLREFGLTRTKVGGDLNYLSSFEHLELLRLYDTEVTGSDMKSLVGLAHLRSPNEATKVAPNLMQRGRVEGFTTGTARMQRYSPLEFPLPAGKAVGSDFDCCFVPQIHRLTNRGRPPLRRHRRSMLDCRVEVGRIGALAGRQLTKDLLAAVA
jgi:hypothetical protein